MCFTLLPSYLCRGAQPTCSAEDDYSAEDDHSAEDDRRAEDDLSAEDDHLRSAQICKVRLSKSYGYAYVCTGYAYAYVDPGYAYAYVRPAYVGAAPTPVAVPSTCSPCTPCRASLHRAKPALVSYLRRARPVPYQPALSTALRRVQPTWGPDYAECRSTTYLLHILLYICVCVFAPL